jgi:hypothetical protein
MNDTKIPRFGSELPRTIFGLMIWAGIGLLVLNAASGRRILECDRQSGQIKCHLTTKELLSAIKIPEFEKTQLQKAIVRKNKGRGRAMYEATLVTTHGDFWISSMDSEQFVKKHRMVDKVNTFLENPQASILKIESSYSILFWILTGIFSAILAVFIFAIFVSLRFPNVSPNITNREVIQSSWGGKLENIDREGEHHRLIDLPEQPPVLSSKIDHESDS